MHFILERDATRYEVVVNRIGHNESYKFNKYLVTVMIGDLLETFLVKELDDLAEHIAYHSNQFSVIDAINIHNAIAENVENLRLAKYERNAPLKVQYA